MRVTGRDFGFSLQGTAAAVSNWECVGGMPITPCVLPSSILRNYCQMYARFKVNSVVVHYITSSPTSQAGDVMFYYERDRKSPFMDYSNSSFLPFVLSDPNTVIGPQWTNHSLLIRPTKEFKSTAFALNSDVDEDACGTVWMFSKTNSSNSPGYILLDYDISFAQMSVNPRTGQLPVSRGQANVVSLGRTAAAVTAGGTVGTLVIQGFGLTGFATTMPGGTQSGDIFKLTFCTTASQALNTWVNVAPSNLLKTAESTDVAYTVDDGFTAYLSWADTASGGGDVADGTIYPTLENALTRTLPYQYNVTATVTYTIIAYAQLVFSKNTTFLQGSY